MSRFVRGDDRTLTLANGDTVKVKAELSAGEARERYAPQFAADGTLTRNPWLFWRCLIVAYLLDWDLKDGNGAPVVIRDLTREELAVVVDSLDVQSFTEIKDAIEGHERAMAAARQAEKKTDGGNGL